MASEWAEEAERRAKAITRDLIRIDILTRVRKGPHPGAQEDAADAATT